MKDEYDFSKGIRGPIVPLGPGKTRITIRIDDDILDWFRTRVENAGGGNYQTDMNDALQEFIANEERRKDEAGPPVELLPWLETQVRAARAASRSRQHPA